MAEEKFTELEGSIQVTPEVTLTMGVAGVVDSDHAPVDDENEVFRIEFA